MSISNEQLVDVIAEASYRLHKTIKAAYRDGRLEELLDKLEMGDLIPRDELLYETYRDGKVLIVGGTSLKLKEIYGCAKEVGIGKERLEYIDYGGAQKYNFKNLQYNPSYRLILFGPAPHSGISKEEKSSILTQLESEDGYPRITRLNSSNGLKITKTTLKDALKAEIDCGYLAIS